MRRCGYPRSAVGRQGQLHPTSEIGDKLLRRQRRPRSRISECAGPRWRGRSRGAGSRRCLRRSCRCWQPVRRVRAAIAGAGPRPPRRAESGQIRGVVGTESRDANSEVSSKICPLFMVAAETSSAHAVRRLPGLRGDPDRAAPIRRGPDLPDATRRRRSPRRGGTAALALPAVAALGVAAAKRPARDRRAPREPPVPRVRCSRRMALPVRAGRRMGHSTAPAES
jgi:hypothetical protein